MNDFWAYYRICPTCDMPLGRGSCGMLAWHNGGRCPRVAFGSPHSAAEIAAWDVREAARSRQT